MLLLKYNLWSMFTIDRKCVGAEFEHVFSGILCEVPIFILLFVQWCGTKRFSQYH